VYGKDATDGGSVRFWVRRFKSGKMDTGDQYRSAAAKSLFNATGTQRLTRTCKMCIDNEGNLVEK